MRVLLLGWLTLALLGCASRTLSKVQSERLPVGVTAQAQRVDVGDVVGLSGMATDGRGRVWSVAERDRVLIPLRLTADVWRADGPTVTLDGIAEHVETESLAWLGGDRFVLGTETQESRTQDAVLVVRVEGARAHVERSIALDYTKLGLRADDNAGIEAACAVGDQLVLGVEHRFSDGHAPIAILNLSDGSVRLLRLKLTSTTGKLAAFDCGDVGAGVIDVLAIERHYGVARVLRFQIMSASDQKTSVVAETLLGLDRIVEPVPNYESIVRLGDDVLLLTDNHHGKVTGPTQTLRLTGLKLARWIRSGS